MIRIAVTCLCLLAPMSWGASEMEFEFVARFAGDQLTLECREGCAFAPPTPHECPQHECTVTVRDRGMSISRGTANASGVFGVAIRSSGQAEPRYEVTLAPKASYVEVECKKGCGWAVERFDCDFGDECVATIDELGIRLGAVASDPNGMYGQYAARQDLAASWVNCILGQIMQARMLGGPITREVALEEAEAACVGHRRAFMDRFAEAGASEVEWKAPYERLIDQAWTMDLSR